MREFLNVFYFSLRQFFKLLHCKHNIHTIDMFVDPLALSVVVCQYINKGYSWKGQLFVIYPLFNISKNKPN